jgi:prevent-host-death family protein
MAVGRRGVKNLDMDLLRKLTVTTCSHALSGLKTMQMREAKASLSAVVAAAELGEATTITRHGKPAAMMAPIEMARRLYPEDNRASPA